MAWTTTHDLEEFLTTAGAFLRANPVEHTVLLSVTATLRAGGARMYGAEAPEYGWWNAPDGSVRGAWLRTPPHPLLLSPMPAEAAAELAEARASSARPTPGVNGGRAPADTFAAAWERLTGQPARTDDTHRLYRLEELTPPRPAPPGSARVATPADRGRLVEWYAEFGREVSAVMGDIARMVDERIGHGGITLWETDGAPVSFAAVTRAVARTVRVGPVYTPDALRNRGYAAAATAAVSQAVLNAGAREVLLFTDLANPTSNALYQRLGYRPVGDHLVLSFEPRAGRT